jgi:hypothetical protein
MPPIALIAWVMSALLFTACAHSSSARDAGELPAYAEDREYFGKIYAPDFGALPWTLAPYARIPGAWQWTVPREIADGRGKIRIAPRWYLSVGDEWIAQFAIGAPRDVDRDAFVDGVINSLTTSRQPRCYERELREVGGIRAR